MFRPLASSHRRPHRRGTSILLIALIMLTLFSAVGVAYVFFAIREARQAQARKEEQATGNTLTAPNPTATANAFFSALLYDVGDYNPNSPNLNDTDITVLLNGLRGHSIGRTMYGRDVIAHNKLPSIKQYTAANTLALTTPWAGIGVFQDFNSGGARNTQVNYTLGILNGNPFLLDPEYMLQRNGITASAVPGFDPTDPTRPYVGKHAPYTYPDLNNFFLAAIDPATGQVMLPSFHRPALFNSTSGTTTFDLNPSNPNWTNPPGRLMTCVRGRGQPPIRNTRCSPTSHRMPTTATPVTCRTGPADTRT